MPPWLPALIETNGEWQSVLAKLYAVFCEDFKHGNLSLNGLPVTCDTRLSEEGMEEGFWHLITSVDRNANQRFVETERACRLAWCGAVIRNAGDQAILEWQYREKESLRTYL